MISSKSSSRSQSPWGAGYSYDPGGITDRDRSSNKWEQRMREIVLSYPYVALGAAAGLGALIGLLVKRR